MWTVIYIAQNKKVADKYKDALVAEGILVQLRQLSLSQDINTSAYEVMVPESEAEEAHEILTGLMGN